MDMRSHFWNRASMSLALSFVLAAGLVGLGLRYANPPQCPLNVTEAEMLESGCNVGANIGLGLIFLLAVAVVVTGIIVAVTYSVADKRYPPPPPITPPGPN
jgi:hypothetical protein